MPELPEVQTIVTDLRRQVSQKRIVSCRIIRSTVVHGDDRNFARRVVGGKIVEIKRRGKFILIDLDRDRYIITHLKMTGKFVVASKFRHYHRHDRAVLLLDNNQKIVFNDSRCFGRLEICDDITKHAGLKKLGWEPWDKRVSESTLLTDFKKRTTPIKNLLLDQSIITGIGNIYASEILFDAKINPFRKSKSLNKKEIARLIRSMRKTLHEAIECNGTSISDYRRVDDKTGNYQNFLKVYGKAGENCVHCTTPIRKLKQQQRSTFLCSNCQK